MQFEEEVTSPRRKMGSRAKKLWIPAFAGMTFLIGSSLAFGASTLDIGTEYRLRGISISRADYGQSSQDYAFYSQRAFAHVGGRFSPNIEIMTQFQALGLAGSSGTVTNTAADPAGDRYPNVNFTPWVQWAYMKATQLYDL